MRIDVNKYLFVGAEVDRKEFFKKAQELGVIEFIDPAGKSWDDQDEEAHTLLRGIKVLRSLPTVHQKEVHDFSRGVPIAKKILEYQEQIEKLEEEARLVNLELSRVSIFGDFSIDDLKYIQTEGKRHIQFFCAKKNSPETIWNFPEVIKIGIEDGLDYFVAINPEPKSYHGMAEIKIDASVGVLKKRIDRINQLIHGIEPHLKEMACYNAFLHQALIHRMDEVHLTATQERAEQFIEGSLFAVEGWVPITQIPMLQPLCAGMHVHVEKIAFEEKDRVPTCLENKGTSRLGEDLVHIYDTPSTTDADPSPWVLWAFALFFGMIIADAGYGIIFLGISIYLFYRFRDIQGLPKRTIKLAMILSSVCIIWGLLTTSFFGIDIGIDNPLRKVSLVSVLVEQKTDYHFEKKDAVYKEWVTEYPNLANAKNIHEFLRGASEPAKGGTEFSYPLYEKFVDDILFELALFIGCIHVCISFLRNIRRHWAAVGWVIFIIGAYLYFPAMLDATSFLNFLLRISPEDASKVGIQMIYGGIGIAVVLALIQKRLSGVLEFMTLIQIACDVLSYLRLYALGLAGMIMAVTFNEIAGMVGVFFGVFVILIGHVINMSLAIMSGVIHGLRLNFLEWYHYSFEGGGKRFKPLALLSKKN